MKQRRTTRQKIHELYRIRTQFDPGAAERKLELCRCLRGLSMSSASDLKTYHAALCFMRAFPDSKRHFEAARRSLLDFSTRIARLPAVAHAALSDTGIAATALHYSYSCEVAKWLAKHARGDVSIEWKEVDDDTTQLDELLTQFLQPVEADYFDSGEVSSRDWIDMASASFHGTDFDWLFAQLRSARTATDLPRLYDATDLPLVWHIGNSKFSISTNVFPVKEVKSRNQGMRKVGRRPKADIQQPLASLQKLPGRQGKQLVNVAMAALAARHRETLHFNHANHREVYIADVGLGTSIVVFGLQERFRYPLECTMGFLILSNGAPVGYGGTSLLFGQANTGVNIFSEYRGSEAAFLWVQVMRVYHHLAGCKRFIANAYQFGEDNDEALKSGAYWFYYRLGFRSVSREIRMLATEEHAKIRRVGNYRSSIRTLRRLASCDMHLTLPGARSSDYFDEKWFDTISKLATEELGAAGGYSRDDAVANVLGRVAKDLSVRGLDKWSGNERHCAGQLAPILSATNIASWPPPAKQAARKLLRAKGGAQEAKYAQLLCENEFLNRRLQAACRAAEKRARIQ